MSERLTRSQRRKIEDQTHQKVDLDHLAEIDVSKLVTDSESTIKDEDNVQQENIAQYNDTDSSLSEEVLSSEEESSSSSSEDEEDLDELLNKAQQALATQTDMIQLDKESNDKNLNTKLSKMNAGISVDKEVYLKKVNGRARLVPDAVALVDDHEKASKKASVVLKESNNLEKRPSKKERQAEREKTTGKSWFDMPKADITDEVKRDLQVLKMRHILDRKRHYKKMGKRPDPKYFQIGTIIESPTEFFSARMTNKERKQTIVDELMASDDMKQYYKRKFNEVQERTNSGGKKHFKKLKAQRQKNK
ncbi:Fcf2 pre-rRNA processing-domain-containing protein [Gilbertella persicaria]|uniref:Fcf2 pre-rRNA processing C-terminal domain-containing protein n=1 Tax=Rhizopus stolonifer TaxID=4846 RepID=A0A367JBE1_RHIST|nr:Fcf2 pre-rRNA processing-domain-containing protein [Gilbertella persicaria]KAI8069828.1 Fcf2 pre-rRNA processing-domain-containing protein [Gilbertella persicaria]RCH87226.1 hypothetical protein CU098_006163 [Rhizopus stolonifer]